MIISEKQIMELMTNCRLFIDLLTRSGIERMDYAEDLRDWDVIKEIALLLGNINAQQSEELKVVE